MFVALSCVGEAKRGVWSCAAEGMLPSLHVCPAGADVGQAALWDA